MSDRHGIESYLHLLDEAFRGRGIEDSDESQALLPNVRSVPEVAWRALPAGAARSIESIVMHDQARLTNWGELRPTRWIVAAMITHDAYHAGEINHLRSLLGTDDRWRHIQMGFG